MLHFNHKDYGKWTRATKTQYQENAALQKASERDFAKIVKNAGLTPQEAYREMEDRTAIILNPVGEFATLQRLNAVSRSVSLGKQVYSYRQSSAQTGGQTSMSGQTGIITDAVEYKYAGTPVPIHDHATERNWRDALTMGADGFDAMVDDQREAELVVLRQSNSYLWNGDASIKGPNGETWLGIKNDPSVVQAALGVDIDNPASTPEDIYQEVKRLVDILRITNNCNGVVDVGVSRETMSHWENPFTTNTGAWGTILDMIKSIGGVASVYEDPELTGGAEIFMAYINLDGLHAVTGQAMSSYMVERLRHNDNFCMIKWLAQSFISKNSYSGQKCALFAD